MDIKDYRCKVKLASLVGRAQGDIQSLVDGIKKFGTKDTATKCIIEDLEKIINTMDSEYDDAMIDIDDKSGIESVKDHSFKLFGCSPSSSLLLKL